MHRSKIIRAFGPANLELAIFIAIHLAVFADDHARNILSALDVRHVERFNPRRKAWQFKSLLHLFEHALHIGLEHAEALLERKLRVLLDQIDHVALLAALWREADLIARTAVVG